MSATVCRSSSQLRRSVRRVPSLSGRRRRCATGWRNPALPVHWAARGFRASARGVVVFVHAPGPRPAGNVLRRYDGGWSVIGIYTRGVPPLVTDAATLPAALDALCSWWTRTDLEHGGGAGV